MKKIGLIVFAIAALLMIVVLTGCKAAPTAPAYADNITEQLLLAYDANDYTAYLEVFDEAATGSVGMEWFSRTSDFNTARIGHYIHGSIKLQDVIVKDAITQVTYYAQYTNEPDHVTVIVSLDITDHGTFAVDISIFSPKMFTQ